MAQAPEKRESEATSTEKTPAGGRRFRLPEFFTKGAEAAAEETLGELDPDVLPVHTGPPVPAREARRGDERRAAPSNEMASDELAALRAGLEQIGDIVTSINEREGALEKVFDTLHSELADYKNDFLYEHLKPVVRPLLFLFDSLEQFDAEVAIAERQMGDERRQTISPAVVRENVRYFRDQLIEALRVCEVVMMDTPRGPFDPKFQKAIDVVPVSAEENNTIQRVVRSGWFLNGQLLRPAEVVVGKHRG